MKIIMSINTISDIRKVLVADFEKCKKESTRLEIATIILETAKIEMDYAQAQRRIPNIKFLTPKK